MKAARVCLCTVLALALGCGDSDNGGTGTTVSPGQSIQAAVDAAAPGDTITVMPGDYTEPGRVASDSRVVAVRITKALKLVAQSDLPNAKVRILPSPGQTDGILVEPANPADADIDGLTITGFTVQGFSNNGIWLRHVNNFDIENNESIDNLENGIWPTLSANGLVKKNVAYGSQDSALWVEGSQNVRVLNNDLHNSPTGLEITVSKEITVQTNEIHDNTIGIGLYHPATAGLGPGTPGLLPYAEMGNWHIIDNYVHDNNLPNPAPEGSETSQLPYGGGILVLGVDHVDVQQNRVENNVFFGIAMLDYCFAVAGTQFACPLDPQLPETKPDYDQFISNNLANNHGAPPDGPFKVFASDMLSLPLGGAGDCFSQNTITNTPPLLPLTIPATLPGC